MVYMMDMHNAVSKSIMATSLPKSAAAKERPGSAGTPAGT